MFIRNLVALLSFLLPGIQPALAQQGFKNFGVCGNIEFGDGIPTNDLLGYGFYTHYEFSNNILIGFALDIQWDMILRARLQQSELPRILQ